VDVVRKITGFYYRKEGKGLQVGSLQGRMEAPHAEKNKKDFILGHFYMIFNLEVGGNPPHFQWSLGQREDLDQLMLTPMLILRYPKSMKEEISILI
jgi:hypothetical protein